MPSTKVPLSIIILTHRHDERFRSCLASTQFAQEVIIFDFHSDNDWAQLKQEFEFRRIQVAGELTDFAAARQEALTKASHTWVMMIDSDEVITSESVPKIKKIISSRVSGASVKRVDVFYGQELHWGEVHQVRLTRLFRKNRVTFTRPVHEVAEVKGKVVQSSIVLTHFAHTNISDFFQAVGTYAASEAEYRAKQKKAFSWSRMLTFPPAKFIFTFIFKLGFLDGWRGLVYSLLMSIHSLLVSGFLYEKTAR